MANPTNNPGYLTINCQSVITVYVLCLSFIIQKESRPHDHNEPHAHQLSFTILTIVRSQPLAENPHEPLSLPLPSRNDGPLSPSAITT